VTDAEKQSDQEGVALEGTGLSNPELVIAWLTGLGITVANTRVAKYKKILAVSTAFTAQGKLKELDRLYPIQERANAFHESGELSLVWQGLQSFDCEILKRKLKKVVEGPLMLLDEKPKSAEPRNTLFELAVAALLASSGIKIKFRDPDDVVARFLHTEILVECKRMQSERRFEERFDYAQKQLLQRLQQEEGPARGFHRHRHFQNAKSGYFVFTGRKSGAHLSSAEKCGE
jgi:hypothetical protein